MIERVYDFMCENRMVSPGARILAAVSGGADSMCLLEILRRIRHRLPFEICVLHVHHGLRERAEEDLTYVSDYCREAYSAIRRWKKQHGNGMKGNPGRIRAGSPSPTTWRIRRRRSSFILCAAAG